MEKPLRIAYLVFAHKNPLQFGRLLKRLYYPECMFYVHVDAKAPLTGFWSAASQVPANAIQWLPKRKTVSWGNFSLSEAYLRGFEAILKQRHQPDFIITISGQDYPIVPNDVLQNWLSEHIDETILDHALVTEDSPHILERVEQYYLSIKPHRTIIYPHPAPTDFRKKLFNSVLRFSDLFSLPRKLPMQHQLYFGSNWFQLKPLTARYLVDFAKANPSYVNFARTTFVPEEFFFQTILLNAPDKIRNTIYNHRMTFMQWDRGPDSYFTPISVSELPDMVNSDKFFARKFDEACDSEVLDALDQHLITTVPSL
ncbi:beta-1,6-N-acetylglucosaminyltransferase [Spirosoma sp.]|uniref:beta-1,6-N-acetylglucosaminyltransferase n=1 Tax=Spirosoma sp. TaxID=1899569 RepID=UPI002608886B|nr:beta-1,6-N-acetylglucosaminyltransferase [Spirosoma sp.]MCX6214425.1 hypothetical protein [Spirosoma sp.]